MVRVAMQKAPLEVQSSPMRRCEVCRHGSAVRMRHRRYCPRCGAALSDPLRAARCTALTPGQRFCWSCGGPGHFEPRPAVSS
jgi:hypothetical protein